MMQRPLGINALVLYLGFALTLAVPANRSCKAQDTSHYPKWSWDHVPVCLHFGSNTRLTNEQVKIAAGLSNFICLEKAHGRVTDRDHPERIAAEDAWRLKVANPEAKVLMYWSANLAWPFTSYNHRFAESHPNDWVLRDARTGAPLINSKLGEKPVYQYNVLNPKVRRWWSDTIAGAVNEFNFDGVFVDGIFQQKLKDWLRKTHGIEKETAIKMVDEISMELLNETRKALGRDRLLIYNGFRTHKGVIDEATSGAKFLRFANGAMIEHFDQFHSATKEDILLYWQMANVAAREGKIVVYKAFPDHEANWTNNSFMKQSPEQLESFARKQITFPLACFLIGAQKHAYFCYGWGYDINDGQLIEYPEYQHRLGPPRGDATREGRSWIFRREFEHALVAVDLERRKAQIKWKSPALVTQPTAPKPVDPRNTLMDLAKLTKTPKSHAAGGIRSEGDLKAIYYDALPWKGKPTRVFAWLGVPRRARGKVPGIVLVHGGGGTAFKEWVKLWNRRGFAAISIAVDGQTDRRDSETEPWKRHDWAGPSRQGIYGDSDQPLADQWMYHAVADTILANSLLRSLPKVDADKVGVMGISWGGVIASTVIGIDDRLAFGIPTYGCGDLATAANQYGRALGDNALYREVWDPMVRMKNAGMPTLWLSWTGDKHFPLDSLRNCYDATSGPHMVALLPDMGHGHQAGWNPPDSYAFAESVVRTGSPWCRQLGVEVDETNVTVGFRSTKSVDKAVLVATSDSGLSGNRRWTETPAELQQSRRQLTVNGTLPKGTTAWFVNIHSGDLVASSDLVADSDSQEPDRDLPEQIAEKPRSGPDTMWTYKQSDAKDLRLSVFLPDDYDEAKTFPAILCFHGGSWNSGDASWHFPECAYWSRRGMIAVSVDYRLKDNDSVKVPLECVKDAKSAIRFLRDNANRLKVDPNKIVTAGPGAGGYLAAATAMITDEDTNDDRYDLAIPCQPNAVLSFTPIFATQPNLSLSGHVVSGLPPFLTFLGDQHYALESQQAFHDSLVNAGNAAECYVAKGANGGFCTGRRKKNPFFYWSLELADQFLVKHGILTGTSSVQRPNGVNLIGKDRYLTLNISTAPAEETRPAPAAATDGNDEHFRRMDKDGNGKVTQEEYVGLFAASYDNLDADKDAVLSKDEFPHAGGFKFGDANKDGQLTRNEYMTIYKRQFTNKDRNQDGVFTVDER